MNILEDYLLVPAKHLRLEQGSLSIKKTGQNIQLEISLKQKPSRNPDLNSIKSLWIDIQVAQTLYIICPWPWYILQKELMRISVSKAAGDIPLSTFFFNLSGWLLKIGTYLFSFTNSHWRALFDKTSWENTAAFSCAHLEDFLLFFFYSNLANSLVKNLI